MKKLTLAILLFALLLSVFAACDNGKKPDEGADSETVSGDGYGDDLPADLRFDGKTFTIATYSGGNLAEDNQGWACYFDADEPEAGNMLEEAAYNRNVEVEQRLDVKIACEYLWDWHGKSEGLLYIFNSAGLSGKELYQAAFMESYLSYEALINDEILYDVAALKYMDLSKSYYNQSANDVYFLRDNLYFFVSDITYGCQSAVMWLVNNEMLVDLGYDANYLYDKVNDGTWTFDVATRMIENLYSDINTDGVPNIGDTFGFASTPYGLCYLYPAAGLKGTVLGEEGFEFDYGTDYAVEVMDKIVELVKSDDVYNREWDNTPWESGRSLFTCWASEIRALRTLDFEFGILPFPKYSESQETYSTSAGGGAMCVPVNISDPDFVGAVLEAMASGSAKYFVPAFYEDFVEQGVIRDDASRENWAKMLNEWGSYEFTRWIKPDDRVGNYFPAFSVISTIAADPSLSSEYVSNWKAQEGVLTEICQEYYDWYLAD